MTCEREQFIPSNDSIVCLHVLLYYESFMLVGGHFLLSFESRMNLCDKSKKQGNSGAFASLRTKA